MAENRLGAPSVACWGDVPGPRRAPAYPKPNLIFLLTFIAFVVARYISVNERMDLLRTVRFEFVLGMMASAFATARILSQPPRIGKSGPVILWIIALFAVIAVQVPFAADQFYAPLVFTNRVFKFAVLAFLIAAMVESPMVMKVFLGSFLFSIFYVTLEATEGLISGGLYWENQGIMRLHGAVSQYGHPNSLGGVALGSLPFIIFLFPHIRNWVLRLGLLATATTSLICVIYSGSRTSYIGLLSLVPWYWFHRRRKLRSGLILLGLGLVVVPLIPNQYIGRFESIGGTEAEGGSKAARIQIMEDAWVILKEHPMGVGVSSFPAVRNARFGRSQDTHNLYLEVATNLGLQGFAVFVGFVTSMMLTFRRSAIDLLAQAAALRRATKGAGLARDLGRQVAKQVADLDFLVDVARAGAGFIFIRLVLGAFGMDLYEIYWWFGAGMAISLSGMVVVTRRRTDALLGRIDSRPQSEIFAREPGQRPARIGGSA